MSEGPLVFQCIACRTIVGDSLRTVGTFEELNAIVLECCANVTKTSSLEVDDERKAFHRLNCACCGTSLGWTYVRAPSHLAALIGAVAFDISSLQSYP